MCAPCPAPLPQRGVNHPWRLPGRQSQETRIIHMPHRTTLLALALSAAGAAAFNKMPTGAPQQRCSLLVSGCTPALLKALPTGVRKALPQEGSTVTGVIYEIETQRAQPSLEIIAEGERQALDGLASFVQSQVAEEESTLRVVRAACPQTHALSPLPPRAARALHACAGLAAAHVCV